MSPGLEDQILRIPYQIAFLQLKVRFLELFTWVSLLSAIMDLISGPNPNIGWFEDVVKNTVTRSILSLDIYEIDLTI